MSPLLELLMDRTERPLHTEEAKLLDQEISAREETIRSALSYDFLEGYTSLCSRRQELDNAAFFERGFSVCAQLFAEILSRYSS